VEEGRRRACLSLKVDMDAFVLYGFEASSSVGRRVGSSADISFGAV